ncbi:MAG: sensor histidine kinase [Thomasclavelia ramosa]
MILVLQRDLLSHEKEEARLQVEREKLKSTLLRSISHDLRTPLTSIAGGANFLVNNLDTVESDTSLNIIQDISKEAMRLNGMVENLLNMTRIQEGNFKINKKLEVVDDIISTAVSAITNRKENHELVVKETKDIILFPCDAQLIVQVLVNLLDNALNIP